MVILKKYRQMFLFLIIYKCREAVMEKGVSRTTEYLLRYIEDEKEAIEQYIKENLDGFYYEFKTKEEIDKIFSSLVDEFLSRLSLEQEQNLKAYTGYQFRNINALLRNNWNYEVNGSLTEEIKQEYSLLAERIREILYYALSLPLSIKAFRGVSLPAFYDYHITTLNDLVYLKGKYLFEDGFTSTSLLKEKCFYGKDVYTLTGKPNILIEYFIPKDSDDGVFLTGEISYSEDLQEFLINSSSLFKVVDVLVDEKNNTAHLKVLLIPEKIWNYQDYKREREDLRIR